MASSPLRVGLVGLGDVGASRHLPALLARDDVELAGVADADPRRLGGVPAPAFASGEELARSDEVDAIVLATPPWATPDLARTALEAGKYVLAEKPIAPALVGAAALADLPAARERLQVGFTYRHHPAIDRLRELLPELGRPLLFQVVVADEPSGDREHDARMVRTLEHGPAVVHEGAHVADRLNLLLGEPPVAVAPWALRTDEALPSANVNGAVLRYRDGTVARVEIVWLLPVLPPSSFVVSGPRGRAVLDPPTFELRVDGARTEALAPPGPKVETCFALQLERFVHACRTGSPPVPGIAEALASLELCERMAA